jgi:hypothetical protein
MDLIRAVMPVASEPLLKLSGRSAQAATATAAAIAATDHAAILNSQCSRKSSFIRSAKIGTTTDASKFRTALASNFYASSTRRVAAIHIMKI